MLRDILDVIAIFFVRDKIFCLKNNLLPLASLEQYISRYKHLPDIPTETEVTENGIDVGDMNAKLLKKIEELTLYIIEQDRKIKALEKN